MRNETELRVPPAPTLPVTISDQSAAEHAAFAREWVQRSQEAVDQGSKTEQEHARTVRATLADALNFLDSFGGVRPPRRSDG